MRLNPIARWRQRRDESNVRVHADAGSLPSSHSHRSSVRGARQALQQIDTELAVTPGPQVAAGLTEFYAAQHPYLSSTVPGLRSHAERCLGLAADDETRAAELMDEANALIKRAARKRHEAEDHFRAAALVELDAESAALVDEGPQVPLDDDFPPRGGEVLDERMRGMGGPSAAEETMPLPRVNPYATWSPGPADLPSAADTRVLPVFEQAGGVR